MLHELRAGRRAQRHGAAGRAPDFQPPVRRLLINIHQPHRACVRHHGPRPPGGRRRQRLSGPDPLLHQRAVRTLRRRAQARAPLPGVHRAEPDVVLYTLDGTRCPKLPGGPRVVHTRLRMDGKSSQGGARVRPGVRRRRSAAPPPAGDSQEQLALRPGFHRQRRHVRCTHVRRCHRAIQTGGSVARVDAASAVLVSARNGRDSDGSSPATAQEGGYHAGPGRRRRGGRSRPIGARCHRRERGKGQRRRGV
mmetsp:Transcript_28611/g.70536  ORF Transcript_28611/g.70536 Transcript_28611/m.70536 type:complete len:250 (+) Transcript_28611:1168-1917(+)